MFISFESILEVVGFPKKVEKFNIQKNFEAG